MERQFHHSDFEKLLKDNADQYRMYPSEKVWENIHSTLHKRPKGYKYSTVALFLFSAAVISFLLLYKPSDKTQPAFARSSQPVVKEILQPINSLQFTPKKQASTTKTPLNPSIQSTRSDSRNTAVLAKKVVSTGLQGEATIVTATLANEVITDPGPIKEMQFAPAEKPLDQLYPLHTSVNPAHTELNIPGRMDAPVSVNIPTSLGTAKRSRFSTQFFFTPTISYRKLTENKRPYSNGSYSYSQIISLNNLVKHKPAMGFEFGIEEKYRLNPRFYLIAGLQFNINRYDIRAYSHPTEIATVAINSGPRTNYIASLSNYRNFNGTNANWLENFYFQAAFPFGAEIILGEKKKFNWGISGTLQPTYVIGDRAYLISSDYKNYAKFPDLMRRWNLSSDLETFVTYSTGKINWQVGPHVRYQHLSSFVSSYPIRENLFAVGLKIGATLPSGKK